MESLRHKPLTKPEDPYCLVCMDPVTPKLLLEWSLEPKEVLFESHASS